jgi:hypothetical protein
MPLFVRNVRQNRWLKNIAEPYLLQDDVPADVMGDIQTSNSTLSVYEIDDAETNLERAVRAVAAGKDNIAATGYVVFSPDLLGECGIRIEHVPGRSCDSHFNQWHRNLIVPSGLKLVALARAILRHGRSGQILKSRLTALMEEGIRDRELPETLREKFKLSPS